MTVPNDTGYTAEADDLDTEALTPFPVYMVNKPQRRQAAHFGSVSSVNVPADSTVNVPVPVLNRRPTRNQAIIYNPVSAVNAPVILNNNPAGLVNNPPQGFQLDSGMQVKLESQQPVYAITGVGIAAVTLGVIDESWETPDGY